MKVSVRVIGDDEGGQPPALEISTVPGAPVVNGRSQLDGLTASWFPPTRGVYVVSVRNLTGRRLLVQYDASRQ